MHLSGHIRQCVRIQTNFYPHTSDLWRFAVQWYVTKMCFIALCDLSLAVLLKALCETNSCIYGKALCGALCLGLCQKIIAGRGRRQPIYIFYGWLVRKFSNYMGNWCPIKSNYMGGWYFAAWKGEKEYYLPKKGEVLSNLAKRKHRALLTAVETALFVYLQSSKLGCFRRILVKNGT